MSDASGSTGLYRLGVPDLALDAVRRLSIYSARRQALAEARLYEKDCGGREWVCR